MRYLVLVMLLLTPLMGGADVLGGRVVRVIDGDTVVVLGRGNVQHKIRLQGIDAPERGQVYAKRDRYQRIIGKVLLSGEDVNVRQVAAGLAWHYKKYARQQQSAEDRERYAEAEIEAREARRGLWREPDPVPPWEWRRR